MNGLMMDWPLLIPSILRRAAQFFPDKEIVSRLGDGSLHRTNYGELNRRVHRLMNVLTRLGVKPGDRVATFAWNHHRHLELYFAVPAVGAVLHTINIRLPREQLIYIINHADDRLIFVDKSVAGPIAEMQRDLPAEPRLRPDGRSRARAGRAFPRRRTTTKSCSQTRPSAPSFPISMKRRPPGFATPRERPASPRACSTAIDRPSCTRWPPAWSTPPR